MNRFASAFLVASLAGTSLAINGCSGSDGEDKPSAIESTRTDPCASNTNDRSGCLTDHYFAGFIESTLPACALAAPTGRLDGKIEIGLLAAAAIHDEAVISEARLLPGYYNRYGLSFWTGLPVRQVRMTAALSGTQAEFEKRLRDVGIDPKSETGTQAQVDQATQIARDLFFGDLRALVTEVSNPVKARIEVVVLSHVASAEFAVLAGLPKGATIAGLGLSPKVFSEIAADEPDKNLFTSLGLPQNFTATLFVGHEDIVKLAKSAEAIVSHELGHCMGLQHTKTSGNLMTQLSASNACRPELTNEQLAKIREGVTTQRAVTTLIERTENRESLARLANAPERLVARYFQKR